MPLKVICLLTVDRWISFYRQFEGIADKQKKEKKWIKVIIVLLPAEVVASSPGMDSVFSCSEETFDETVSMVGTGTKI